MNGYHGIYHPHPGPGPLRRRRRRRPKDSLGHQEVIVRIDLNTGRFLPSPLESRGDVSSAVSFPSLPSIILLSIFSPQSEEEDFFCAHAVCVWVSEQNNERG